MEDSLRGGTTFGNPVGGAFEAGGWRVTSRTDRIWFEIPRLSRGSIQFTMEGVSSDPATGNLIAADNELFAMYEAGYGIAEPIRYSPEFRNNHYKCLIRVYGQNEAERVGAIKLMWGLCPSGAPGYDACGCASFFQEPFVAAAWDGSPQVMRVEWGDGVTRLSRNGAEVVSIDWSESGLSFGPDTLHFSIGTSRPDAVDTAAMPIGALFYDLVVDGELGAPAECPFTPLPDAGVPDPCATAANPITAVSLDPSAGWGASEIFTARYRHCAGASTFRIVQLTVGDAVDAPDAVALGYENGVFFAGTESCLPGEARTIRGVASGALDCARSSVRDEGTDRIVEWAIDFDPAVFAGPHQVFFDAKGGPDPEPRLGWTPMGTFTVTDAPPPPRDAGRSGLDAGRGGGRDMIGGCGCRAAPRSSTPIAWIVLALAFVRRR
jgi:MYXO-CTERM domain-containing protein